MDLPDGTEVITMNDKESSLNQEKRIHERSNCKGLIKWSYFNQSNSFIGELLNLSRDGIYFETSKDVKVGANLFIQFTKYFRDNLSSNDKGKLRNICLGEVKHSNKILKDDSTCYGVGIKYIY